MFQQVSDKAYHLAPVGADNEDAAIRQLASASEVDGVVSAVGFPDLTPGKGGPVGAALLSHALHPVFLGGDLGCAYSLFRLSLKPRRLRDPAKLLEALDGMDAPLDEATRREAMLAYGLPFGLHDEGFATIGLGNHFLEIQKCHAVPGSDGVVQEGEAYLLVHAGSRALGDATFRAISAVHGANPLDPDSVDGRRWIEEHDHCVRWARASQREVADRVCERLDVEADLLLTLPHNMVERVEHEGRTLWLHRKGAAPATTPFSVLPGSRETPSFIVRPLPSPAVALHSLAHGAGRRLSRSAAGNTTLRPEEMIQAPALVRGDPRPMVACGRHDLLAEERGAAYKNVHSVLDSMVEEGLCAVEAEMHPVATFKVSTGVASPKGKQGGFRQSERERHAERDRDRAAKKQR